MVGVSTEVGSSRMQQLTAGRPSGFRGLFNANRYILCSSLFAVIGSFLYGTDQGVLSNLLTGENFGAHFPKVYSDAVLKGWVVSVLQLGAWLGALLNGPLANKISRKYSIMVAAFLFTLGSAICSGAQSVSYFFAGRIIAGLAVGQVSHVVPLYLAEIAPSEIRGALVSLQQLGITGGIMVSYWVCYGTSFIGGQSCTAGRQAGFGSSGTFDPYTDVPVGGCNGQSTLAWRLPLGLQTVPSAILLIGAAFLPYSPRWLMSKGREDECRAVISRLRALPPNDLIVETEWLEIKAAVIFDQQTAAELHPGKSGFMLHVAEVSMLFTNRGLFRRLSLGCILMFFQQFSGINAIIYYAPTIFAGLGLNGATTSLLATGVLGVVDFVFTFPAVFFVDRWGRRKFLMAGALGMLVGHVVVAGIVGHYAGDFSSSSAKAAGWVGVVFIYIFGANFSYSWGPVGWLLPSEIFSPGHRSQAVGIIVSCNYMMNFVVGQVTPNMLATLKFGTHIFFGAFCLLMFFWVLFFVPETRYKSLEEMDIVFKDNTGTRDRERMRAILSDIGLAEHANGSEKADLAPTMLGEKMPVQVSHHESGSL